MYPIKAVSSSQVEESHVIFLRKLEENLEREIDSLTTVKECNEILGVLYRKLKLLEVPEADIRNVFIQKAKEPKSLLESEYKRLTEVYQAKYKTITGDKKQWEKSLECNQFLIEEILKIKKLLQQDFLSNKLSQIKYDDDKIKKAYDWLKDQSEKRNLAEINRKIHNKEILRKDHQSPEEMAELRERFSKKHNEIITEVKKDKVKEEAFLKEYNAENIDEIYISTFQESKQGQELTRDIVAKRLEELKHQKGRIQEEKRQAINDLKPFYSSQSYPIVWASVGKKTLKDGQIIDDFKYGSKKPQKEVYKPYSEIHKALMDANWALRDGERLTPNYITAHILFVVSDKPHYKTKEQNYDGGRTYIDFPINFEWKAEWDEKFLEEHNHENLGRGVNRKASYGQHSEQSLQSFLTSKANVKNIVEILKNKLAEKFGINEGFKIYEVNIFMNSNKNICNMKGKSCEQILNNLQSSKADYSFLHLLKTELNSHGLKSLTSSNDQFPRMLISVSAYEYFAGYCSYRLTSDASKSLLEHKYDISEAEIDTKRLAGKIVLSCDELSINPDFEYKKKFGTTETYLEARKSRAVDIILKEDGVPFYSGFASAGGDEDLIEEKREKYQMPRSFDGVANLKKEEELDQVLPSSSPSSSSNQVLKKVQVEK